MKRKLNCTVYSNFYKELGLDNKRTKDSFPIEESIKKLQQLKIVQTPYF
jgi:hypothetical protein